MDVASIVVSAEANATEKIRAAGRTNIALSSPPPPEGLPPPMPRIDMDVCVRLRAAPCVVVCAESRAGRRKRPAEAGGSRTGAVRFCEFGDGLLFFRHFFRVSSSPPGRTSRGGPRAPPQVSSLTMDPMANICTNFGEVGQAFITHYYQVFDNDRTQLGSLYKDEVSMLNFEHNPGRPGQFKGTAQILEKLTNLPFRKVQHQVVTIDCQPTPGGGYWWWCAETSSWTTSRCRRNSRRCSSSCRPAPGRSTSSTTSSG